MSDLYNQRGVSAQKEEVHAATQNINKGLFKNSFCQIFPDILGNDDDWVNVIHADGAGTKTILAYLYWKETGDINVWKKVAQDAIVMNIDDMLCVGITDNFLFSSSIDRNKSKIPGEVLKAIIDGTNEFFENMKKHDVNIFFGGGETADVGDIVNTVAINGTITSRWKKDKIITNEKIKTGNVIIGLESYGQATFESDYNSGIGSNGLTSARHDILSKYYEKNYPETFDSNINKEVIYNGPHKLTDTFNYENKTYEVGSLITSPTRTYAPFVKALLKDNFNAINGMIHCSGGGQTKCLKYQKENIKIVKDNLITVPPVFKMIQACSGAGEKELFEVFNMGCRLEIYTDEKNAAQIIALAKSFNIHAQQIGYVTSTEQNEISLNLHYNHQEYNYKHK